MPFLRHFEQRPGAWLACVALVLALCLVLAIPLTSGQSEAALIAGSVLDQQDHPVPGAHVTLLDASGTALQSASTDSFGVFRFKDVAPGTYRLSTKRGNGLLSLTSLTVLVGERASVTLKLGEAQPTSSSDPAFFDQPAFAVAGVTDTTNLAVHGSDKIARKKDELAKDVVDFAGLPPQSTAAGGHSNEAEDVRKLIANENYVEAEARLQSLVRTQDRAELHGLLGNINEKRGNSLDAVREYQRAAEMDPSENNLMQWGSEFLLHHAPDAAVQVFAEGTRRFPSSPRLLAAHGVALYIGGSYEQAASDLCRASDMDPRHADVYFFIGRIVEAEQVITDSVLDRLARFAKQSPESAQANYFYALALSKRHPGETAAVIAMLRKATELDPKLASAYLQLGIMNEDLDPRDALDAFQHAIEANPKMPEAHFRLAQLYRKLGNDAGSRAELALFQQRTKDQSDEAERQRHDIQQFVFAWRPSAN